MAILSKIRDKSILLIAFVGLAMFLFVANPSSASKFFSSKKANSVGTINGEDITREEFTERVKEYSAANGNNSSNDTQATKQVWESIIAEKIFNEQLSKAGIVIGEKEIWNAIISDPSINSSPTFQNEAGLFDEESLKTWIAEAKEDTSNEGKQKWASWLNYERQVKQNLERNAYVNAVSVGLGIPLQEAAADYVRYNTRVTGKYVFVPFSSIPDSTVQVSDKEIESYIKAHKEQFKTKSSRGIQFVVFDVLPSAEDKNTIKSDIEKLKNDFVEYNKVAKTEDTIKGLSNTTDIEGFIAEYSETPYNKNVVFKGSGQKLDTLFNMSIGTVYGPYEENGYYKISKAVEQKQVPSSKASHILISFKETGNPNAVLTKEEAKAKADDLMSQIKAGADFATLAQTNSEDRGSATRGGDLNWFKEGQMVPEFNDWVFSHGVGELGIVETQYGYHIIKKTDAKSEPGMIIATVAKVIEPSDATLNKAFAVAEGFNSKVSNDKKAFSKIAEDEKLNVRTAERLGRMDEMVPGLQGQNSQIVSWAFEDNTKTGDIKRFDLDKSYVVAQLIDKQKEGIMSVKTASNIVKPILIAEKKAVLLSKKLEKGSLEELAQTEKTMVNEVKEASLADPNPSLTGDSSPIGAMLSMKSGSVVRDVVGKNGVYAVELAAKNTPPALNSYEPLRLQLEKSMRKDIGTIYNALKDATDIGELILH